MIDTVRRSGTISITVVYRGGTADPLQMLDLFDKGVTLRTGQAHGEDSTDDLTPLRERRPARHGRPRNPHAAVRARTARLRNLPRQSRTERSRSLQP
jgi:hypothetical protein